MHKIRKYLILLFFVCVSTGVVPAAESKAEKTQGEQAAAGSGMTDENPQRLEEVTGMDPEGNIFSVDSTGGIVDVSNGISLFSRSSSVKVVNFRTKGNAITEYKEYGTGKLGYTNGAYGGDAAYLGQSNGKVRFMLSGVVGEVDASEVQVVNLTDIAVVSCYEVENGRLIHKIAHDITTPGWATRLDNGAAPSYLQPGVRYYGYDGHYFYTDYETMLADYQNNTRSNSVNAGNPYYNYYQYLPLRSRTSYSGAELDAFMSSNVDVSSKLYSTGNDFVGNQDTYGVNALIMNGLAINESGWGKSEISQQKNNLFGLNAVDSSPGTSASTYASPQVCIQQFASAWMSRGYLYPKDNRYNGGFLGNKASGLNVKYASDPYWGEKAANIAYLLDKRGGNRDYDTYTIGIKDTISTSHNDVNVRSGSSTETAALYSTGSASNYAVLIQDLSQENGFYRIQSDGVLDEGRTALAAGQGEYGYDSMYAYISAGYITPVNQGSSTVTAKRLQSIYISQAPGKTVYTEGELFDPAGMSVIAKWSDGTEADVTSEVVYPADALQAGMSSVDISYTYEGVTVTVAQNITVNTAVAVTGVAINPSQTELKAGESRIFGIRVTGTGNPSQDVIWSVEGAASADTQISQSGMLQIGADETADVLIVRAASAVDQTKSAEAQVTVIREEPEQPDSGEPDPGEPGEPCPGDPDAGEPEQPGTSAEVKNEETGIWVNGNIPEGAALETEILGPESENYALYIEPVKNHTILGVYDISLTKELAEGESVELGFPVDEAYNGQEILVLHYAYKDGETTPYLERYSAAAEGGKVTITVRGFSPYVLALNDPSEGTDTTPGDTAADPNTDHSGTQATATPTDTTGTNSPSSQTGDKTVKTVRTAAPKTGDTAQIGILILVLIAAAAGIVYVIIKKKKQ